MNPLVKALKKHASQEWVAQPHKADFEFEGVQSPAARNVATRRGHKIKREQGGGDGGKNQEHAIRCFAQTKCIDDVRDVFEEEGPGCASKRLHLLPSADVHGDRDGNHRATYQRNKDELRHVRLGDMREDLRAGALVEEQRTKKVRDDDHRLKADEAAFEEVPKRHTWPYICRTPAIVVRVGDDKSRKHEEKSTAR